ncbi:MAG: hypothetical protein M1815_003779 [Lichina confinis]|nr:MAG: hypothetical protein M1815_003779 [Lichina confinis]
MSLSRSRITLAALASSLFVVFVWFRLLPAEVSPSVAGFFGSSGGHRATGVVRRPTGVPIIALVFYGRKRSVSILDCYLKKNLADNGGFLDRVVFFSRTNVPEDLEYLEYLLTTTASYVKVESSNGRSQDYSKPWETLLDGPIYIKIDDDVVYMEDNAIPSLVKTLVDHPEYLLVSANMINQPAFSWVHWHLGVVHPYLPELEPAADHGHRNRSWRASELPQWTGPADHNYKGDFSAPFEGHRWLPLPKGTPDDTTPIAATTYHKAGRGWHSWAVAAQQHYSFFENLENGALDTYHLGTWDMKYDRISIQLLAIRGKDVLDNLPFESDDEAFLTEVLPRKLGRHAVIDGDAIANHYSFGAQQGREMREGAHGMEWTDVMDRYRAYAEEMVCVRPTTG